MYDSGSKEVWKLLKVRYKETRRCGTKKIHG